MGSMSSPDPVSEALEYQNLLLSLLGDDDPAEVQSQSIAAVKQLLAQAGDDLRTIPAEGEWSVWGCLAHLVDAEVASSGRYRWILAQDQPPLPGYDQDRWVERLHPTEETAREMLDLWSALRASNLALWARTPEGERDRFGMHAERGPESYRLTFQLIAGHDRFHLEQIHLTLQAVRSQSA